MANFHLKTQYKETEVVTGATIELSLGDAKTLLDLTDENPEITPEMAERGVVDKQEIIEQNFSTVIAMMRTIAQKILDQGITRTDSTVLFEQLTGKDVRDVFPNR